MIRKAGKLPWETIWIKYWLEYWSDEIELQNWAIEQWQKIALVDDLLATWWTMWAAAKLVEQAWWEIENIVFAISLDEQVLQDMSERQNLWKYTLDSILQYN
jgi:adenine phosphoribosyltransferase